MTTHTELLEIIANGENSGVEFKRDELENHALAKNVTILRFPREPEGQMRVHKIE
jgi:hypothetical protein